MSNVKSQTWLDLGHRLLNGDNLKKELNEISTEFMTGCLNQLSLTGNLSAKQSAIYIRNINIHLGTKFSEDCIIEADGYPDEAASSKSESAMDDFDASRARLDKVADLLTEVVALLKQR